MKEDNEKENLRYQNEEELNEENKESNEENEEEKEEKETEKYNKERNDKIHKKVEALGLKFENEKKVLREKYTPKKDDYKNDTYSKTMKAEQIQKEYFTEKEPKDEYRFLDSYKDTYKNPYNNPFLFT